MQQRRILITAGPTRESLDEVRYLANRSSGRLGLALAEAAHGAGWNTTLLLGPAEMTLPAGVHTVSFESTADLQALLDQHFPACDVLVMAAAVSDYRPASVSAGKLPCRDGRLTLELEATPDLVATCAERRRPGQRIIGFALEEPAQLHERATEKLRRKNLDALVANPLSTMGAPRIDATVYTATGETFRPPADDKVGGIDKTAFARWFINWIGTYLLRGSA